MIFRNLLDNAFKYAGTPPLVEVALCPQDGERVLVEIRDNGLGIPARMRKKIFRRFVRLGSELEREKPGTGLGLYIVQTLVKRLRGTVRVRDQERGPERSSRSPYRASKTNRRLRPLTRKCNSRS